jgi:hypothetical protein
MFPRFASRQLLNVIAISMLVAGLTVGQAQHPAGPKRPRNVPAEYVITPFGYFHPSCVNHLANGDEVLRDERAIRHGDGSSDSIQACQYPRFNATGEPAQTGSGVHNPTVNGWVEEASTTTSSSFAGISAQWTVPLAPYTNHGQVIYFFPGLESYSIHNNILQPVLEWYQGVWYIASWNCCVTGAVNEGPVVVVHSGDSIYGSIFQTCAGGTVSCSTWNINITDQASGKGSSLSYTSSRGESYNWALAGVLEAYYLVACTDYPVDGGITFHDLKLYSFNYTLIPFPTWYAGTYPVTPSCGYGGSLPQQLTLTY